MEKIVIVGAGGHAKTVVDTIERLSMFEIEGFLDQKEIGLEIYRGYKIIGRDEDRELIFNSGIRKAIIAVGFMGKSKLRNSLYSEYKKCGFDFPAIVDPTAIVAKDVILGEGAYVGRNAVINANAKIGINAIVNTAAIVEHECIIGDFTHVAVSAVICGQARVGNHCLIGANSTVIQGIKVLDDCVVGAGAVVIDDLPADCTAVGVPAKAIKIRD